MVSSFPNPGTEILTELCGSPGTKSDPLRHVSWIARHRVFPLCVPNADILHKHYHAGFGSDVGTNSHLYAYSDRSDLPTLETLVQQKGSIEGVLKSVGKTRQVVDRIGVVSRVLGPALIVLQVTMIAVVIWKTPPEERVRVAAREVGGAVGSASFGVAGAWAGCVAGASLASPTLIVPIWGEVSEGGACLVGGVFGSLGFGLAGSKLGQTAGENIYFWTTMNWTRR